MVLTEDAWDFMAVDDVFGSKDRGVRSLLVPIVSLLLAFWGSIAFDSLGFSIPILRQFTGFLLLTFVPGILILHILRIRNLDAVETTVYAVGISLSTLMFTGFFINLAFPFFGVIRPISLWPLVATVSILVTVLCFLTWVGDLNSTISWRTLREVLFPPVLVLSLLPLSAIFGTYLVNFYNINSLLMILLLIISLVPSVIVCSRLIPEKYYSYAVFTIAIALLYHTSLISMYIWGWDIQVEYYLANTVIQNGLWDFTTPGNANAMLSIEMLAPIYSNICGMSLTWVFKIIYPLLFALVPLGLYNVFQKQTNSKIAFLSCFFFMSIFTFYTEMLALARQQIAELFIVLLILLMINKNLDRTKRSFLFIVFGISLAVSHYGLSYIYMFCLISAWLILVSGENRTIQKMMSGIYSKFESITKSTAGNPVHLKVDITISSILVLIFVTFTIAWYIYISNSSAFITIVNIGGQIAGSIFTEFLNPKAAQGLELILSKTVSPLYSVTKYLHLLAQFFIIVGVAMMVLRRKEMKFEREYEAFVLLNFAICIAGIALPYFSSQLNTSRLYQITLIFLAPFCVIGGIAVLKMVAETVMASWMNKRARILRGISLRGSLEMAPVLSIFLALFLLFNSGWAYEVAKDHPGSIALNSTIDFPRFNEQEVKAVVWLNEKKDMIRNLYADEYRSLLLLRLIGNRETFFGENEIINPMPSNFYIFLGRENVQNGRIILIASGTKRNSVRLQNLSLYNTLLDMNEIYKNGDSLVCYR